MNLYSQNIKIMRKLFLLALAATVFSFSQVSAQSTYKNAIGLGIDFGDGATLVGPSFKHFFNSNNAIQAEVLFGDHVTFITPLYQYHSPISGAAGLQWYLGGGPSVGLYDGGSDFYLRPMAGLDYKVNGAPLAFAFDWRPAIYLGDNDSNFEAARFGIGFRYTF